MSLTLLSMAGVPPLMGFWGKYFILVATMSAKFYILTYITIFISTISNFYYIAILLTS
jgi:NADH-quinone oxidoreductase subunit N